MWSRSITYCARNWGAPFIIAFIILLVASALLLSNGQTNSANALAVYAFYALVLGVILQIVSYVKFGESQSEEPTFNPSWAPPKNYRPGRRTLALILVALVILATFGSVAYYYQSSTSNSTHTIQQTSARTIGPLVAGVNFIAPTMGANNSLRFTIGINETGGVGPFSFTAHWSDGVNQTNDVGVFIRSFSSNETIPNSVNVVVMSSDGQSAVITVQIPEVNRTTSTTSSSEVPTIKFIESGLPSGSMWTLILNNFQYRSYGNQMVINHTIGGPEEYSVFGPYDQKSFEWAFIPSPQSGTINTSLSTQINLVFSNLSISTPANNLFVLSKPISTTIMSGGSVQLNATYLNIFPEPVQVVVLATATDDNTGSISVATATIEPLPSAEQTAIILFRGLAPGSYTVTLSVASLGGVQLSSATNFTFIIP